MSLCHLLSCVFGDLWFVSILFNLNQSCGVKIGIWETFLQGQIGFSLVGSQVCHWPGPLWPFWGSGLSGLVSLLTWGLAQGSVYRQCCFAMASALKHPDPVPTVCCSDACLAQIPYHSVPSFSLFQRGDIRQSLVPLSKPTVSQIMCSFRHWLFGSGWVLSALST